ncbi:hypothetical protein O7626_09700 [Micromonospora sp. WMMD1102]|uniref:hypothetical protein n=1 Tax=Micromonospora sp. WMMD1102 TaxID=3016105 RepID=UPI002415613A|nr:hypothetical protein [Micromonospora sp. WMMD1102]MDG4786199.1 hypothetical protein [Micromonospora sp. WMMD1102]
MVTVLDFRRTRSGVVLGVACAAVLALGTACAGNGGERPQWSEGVSGADSGTAAPTPTEASPTPTGTPTPKPTAARATRPPANTATTRRARTMAEQTTATARVTGGFGQSQNSGGLHQEGCGSPTFGLVQVRVGAGADVSAVTVRYRVNTPVPFDGSGSARTLGNDRGTWLAGLGPFRAEPRNSAGGTIAVTATVKFRDGSTRSARTSTPLQPCRL